MQSNKIPWVRVLVEGVVIVGSIHLAFALDAWWDSQSREAELREQAHVVAGEVASVSAAVQRVQRSHELAANLTAHLSAALREVPEGAEIVVSDTLVGPLLPQATADVSTGSIDTFVAAGGLELIEDEETRGYFLEWSAQIEDLQDDEIYLRNFAGAALNQHLRANYAVANAELWAIPVLLARFHVGTPVVPDVLGTVTLRHEQQLLNYLAARESGERGLRAGLLTIIEQADLMVEALEGVR